MITGLFDGFCSTDDPAPWLGKRLRTEEAVALMKELGEDHSTGQEEGGHGVPDKAYSSRGLRAKTDSSAGSGGVGE